MKVPMADPKFNGNELKYLTECIKSGWISSQGKFINEFEKRFADWCGTDYAVSCSSGTAALHLSLLAFGIGPGDEVIIPDMSFVATGNAVLYVGATPIFVDIRHGTYNIDETKIESVITKKTKAIIVVHLFGRPCYMTTIMGLAKKYNLIVIEDAAEAHGADIDGKMIGSIGHAGCFSFFGNKLLTTGEGGMVITNNPITCAILLLLRDHGMSKSKRFWHPMVGYNYRMTNMQAAIGVAQLEQIGIFIQKRKESGRLYDRYLSDLSEVQFPYCLLHEHNVFWVFPLLLNTLNKEDIMLELHKKGIDSRPFFYPFHKLPAFKEYSTSKFPVSEKALKYGICLPTHSPGKVKFVCDTLKRILKGMKNG